jgi:hypothetical protein
MVAAKIIRLKVRGRRQSGNLKDSVTGAGIIPEAMAPIEWLVAADLPKAYPTLVWLSNRNRDGVSPREWYEFICEALDLEPREEDYAHPSSSGLLERND